jgi:2-polyprenyl-6-methoxyphenol hydroxylase-like FAD-dependent oxidoreductase
VIVLRYADYRVMTMVAGNQMQVLIVGGGLSGLTVAGSLRDADIEPVVIESDETVDSERDRGIVVLWPEALTLLAELGISVVADDTASAVDTWTRRQLDGTVTHRRESDTVDVVTLPYATLRERLSEIAPEETVQSGRTLQSIEVEDGFPTATFANGVREQFDMVVGADGARSRTRALLGGPTPHQFGTQTWTFPLPSWQNQNEATEIWTKEGIVFRVLPSPEAGVGYLTIPGEKLKQQAQTKPVVTNLGEAREVFDWGIPAALDEADEDDVQTLTDTQLATNVWGERRIALVGDAAHVHHQLTSLGPTLAIEDAVALASELRHGDDTIQARVAEYISRRKARLDQIETVSSEARGNIEAQVPSSYRSLLNIRTAQIETHFSHGDRNPR